MGIEIIEIAVNPDHVHIFFKYPPKYSLSYIAKKLKGRSSRVLREEFPPLWNGVESIAGLRAVFMGVLGMGGMLLRNIFQLITHMNTIGNNLIYS